MRTQTSPISAKKIQKIYEKTLHKISKNSRHSLVFQIWSQKRQFMYSLQCIIYKIYDIACIWLVLIPVIRKHYKESYNTYNCTLQKNSHKWKNCLFYIFIITLLTIHPRRIKSIYTNTWFYLWVVHTFFE